MKNWLIKKLGGHTDHEFKKELKIKKNILEMGFQESWAEVPKDVGVIENDIKSNHRRNGYFGRNKYIFGCPICENRDHLRWQATKLDEETVGVEVKCVCGETWQTRTSLAKFNMCYTEEEMKEFYELADKETVKKYIRYQSKEAKHSAEDLDNFTYDDNVLEMFRWAGEHINYTFEDMSEEKVMDIVKEVADEFRTG